MMNTTKSTNELRIARNLIRLSSFDEDTKNSCGGSIGKCGCELQKNIHAI